MKPRIYKITFIIFASILSIFGITLIVSSVVSSRPLSYVFENNGHLMSSILSDALFPPAKAKFVASHILKPEQVRAVYMTSWVAGTPSIRSRVVQLIEETEINSVVIDIKDATGKISFIPESKLLLAVGSGENRIPDIRDFLADLHRRGIYVIGRVSVFQDPILVASRPDLAVLSESTGEAWKDYKGISWVDPAAKDVWDYNIEVARESYHVGFDEINFDYVRFPSDGNMRDLSYRHHNPLEMSRADRLGQFFEYLVTVLRNDTDAVLSADLFGMTTTNADDLNIGQVLSTALQHFDYVAPMVYPSHYPRGFLGYKNPADFPYEVVLYSMANGVKKAMSASSSPLKLRPWLQDFDLGAVYDAEKVRAQIQAVYDVGLDSWMLWDPTNKYTRGALLPD